MKNRRRQDERHSLFNVCSVGRLVVLSHSMSLLILNQEAVIQFFIGQNSQNPICMYPTLSPYIIRNHQKYIAAWTNCPTNWEAIMSQRFLPLFLSRRANGLAYSSISPTHQRFMLQKTNVPWFPFSTLHQHMKLLIKRHISCASISNHTVNYEFKTHGRISFTSHSNFHSRPASFVVSFWVSNYFWNVQGSKFSFTSGFLFLIVTVQIFGMIYILLHFLFILGESLTFQSC